jgi:probable phosphoglycerate mutase
MATRVIDLVRHGQYVVTTAEGEEPDGRLTSLGQEQATLTGQRLQKQPISLIHHSNLERAVETAVIISHYLPHAILKPSPILRECIPSVPKGFEAYFEQVPAAVITGGKDKAQQAFETFIMPQPETEDDHYELIVSHGNMISSLICQALKAPLDSWILADIQHASLSEIVSNSQGWQRLIRHNDVGHLSPHMQTFL